MDEESRTVVDKALTHPKYRQDIDGLRAVAILSVIGFHGFPEWIRGGFIGVDIFFVISGFLISTIIFKSLSCNKFSFIEFYSRRVRRIFPALATVLLATFAVGWFVFYPDEYRHLGKHMVGGAWFVSNLLQWGEAGYFESASETQPLLHLWSLGIEEQFYIAFPFLVWLLWKARLNPLVPIVSLGMLSFFLNTYYVSRDAEWTFYQPQTRIWELLVGSVLSLLILDQSGRVARLEAMAGGFLRNLLHRSYANVPTALTVANFKAWTGIILIVTGLLSIEPGRHFPGSYALLPTLGAASMIWAGPGAFLNRWLLSHNGLVWVGKISYPLYLWHWVLLSYLHIATGMAPAVELRVLALAAAVALSWVTCRMVENPLRLGNHGSKKTFALVAAIIAVSAIGLADYCVGGFATQRSLKMGGDRSLWVHDLYAAKSALMEEALADEKCFQLPPNKDFAFFLQNDCLPTHPVSHDVPVLLLIGDSHAASLSLGIRPWAQTNGFRFYQATSGSFPLFVDAGVEQDYIAYGQSTFEAVKLVRPDVLIIDSHWQNQGRPGSFRNSGKWPSYADYLIHQFQNISGLGAKQVIIVGQIPTWEGDLPDLLAQHFVSLGKGIPERTFLGLQREALAMDTTMSALNYPENFHYFSLKDTLCNKIGCLTRVGSDISKDLTVFDYGHLTVAGAKFVMDQGLAAAILATVSATK